MKLEVRAEIEEIELSPPAREVWVEIDVLLHYWRPGRRRLPRGRCGLKSVEVCKKRNQSRSPPAREVWVEIDVLLRC